MAPGFGDAWRRRKAPSWQQQPRSPSPSPERPPPSPAPCAPPGGGASSPPHLLGGSGAARRPSHSPAPGASGCRPQERGGGGGGRGAEPRGGARGLRQPGCASRGFCPPGPAASIVVPRRERSPQGAGMEPSGGERSPLGGNGAPSPGHRPPGQPGLGGKCEVLAPPGGLPPRVGRRARVWGKKGPF